MNKKDKTEVCMMLSIILTNHLMKDHGYSFEISADKSSLVMADSYARIIKADEEVESIIRDGMIKNNSK